MRRLYDGGRAASMANAAIFSTNCGMVVPLGTEDPRSDSVERMLERTPFGSSSSSILTPQTMDHSSACRELDVAPNSLSSHWYKALGLASSHWIFSSGTRFWTTVDKELKMIVAAEV